MCNLFIFKKKIKNYLFNKILELYSIHILERNKKIYLNKLFEVYSFSSLRRIKE